MLCPEWQYFDLLFISHGRGSDTISSSHLMRDNLRKILIIAGCALLVIGGIVAWRATHPPLTDEQQIAANLEAMRVAVENRNAKGVTWYLAADFRWQGLKKSDVHRHLAGAFVAPGRPLRDVQVYLSGLRIEVRDDSATTTGHYNVSYRIGDAPAESRAGDFTLQWQKRDGQWKIVQAEGGGNIGMAEE